MNTDWEKTKAQSALGNLLSVMDKLELAQWELWWLTIVNWSKYA